MEIYFKDPTIEYLGKGSTIRDVNGVLLMFESPKKDQEYVIGADIGGGLGLSNSVAHVLKVGTRTEPDIQVAEFASNYLSPTEFAFILDKLGNAYWSYEMDLPATLNVETNNYGHTVIAMLVEQLDYLNLFQNVDFTKVKPGSAPQWGTGVHDKTRVPLVMLGESRLKSGQWVINSVPFIEEMADFQITNIKHQDALNREILADQGKAAGKILDDRLFAGFHALWAANAIHPDIMLDRERRRIASEKVVEALKPGEEKPDYRNTPISYDAMMRELDGY